MNIQMADTLTALLGQCLPEALLVVVACVIYLGGTWRTGRNLWGAVALGSIVAAAGLL